MLSATDRTAAAALRCRVLRSLSSLRSLLVLALVGCGTPSTPAPQTQTAPVPAAVAPPATARISVHIDRRVELVSIVCALAGFKEYTLGAVNPYRTAVINAFRPFLGHPAVAMARELREQHGIGHDAPMILAVHLDEQLELTNAEELPLLDARWTGVDAAAYAAQLRDFATVSKLDAFMATHRAHYAAIEDTLGAAVEAEHPVEWFDAMFGKPKKATYTVVPSPMTGTYNFGVRATRSDGTLELYQLLAVDTPTGLPVVNDELVYLLVHELAHSYINPVLAQHAAILGTPAAKLFERVQGQMKAQAYSTWQIMLDESVVRATTVVYLRDRKGDATAEATLAAERERGFLWTMELAELMQQYQQDHQDYVPGLARLLTALALK